ncbi:hypothetical protein, partial [Actinobacillus pleuropneumoniae]|uniref:hypothetical protein n=1 Tax=Actinobacillus pleuropneumoniae TaxID=715 RepID=UPI00227B2438
LWPMSRNRDFLGNHKTPTLILVNSFTAIVMVSSILQAHQAGSGFSHLGAIPLTMRHLARGGVELPPSSRANYRYS